MGWVNLAMAKILELTLDVPRFAAMAVCLILTGIYVMIGGLWGVLVTDVLQFAVKMTMAIVLAAVAVAAAGGMGSLEHHLALLDAQRGGGSSLSFFPTGDQSWLPALSFLTYIAVQWWASSYPGAEPGGGGYVAQRIFSARSERDSTLATLFFNVAHYALRPWPWILVALAALVLYPHGVHGHDGKPDPELGYVQAMIDYLPPWLRGLMMAGFLAAFMSTIGTHLNLGASYLTNDLYRRFLVRDADEKHYLGASRIATLIVMGLSVCGAFALHSVGDGWKYLFNLTAGVGPVMILRWYWWRVNAWSEISALAASAIVSNTLILTNIIPSSDPNAQAKMLLVTVTLTSIVWLTTTMLTRPESPATLEHFYLRVRPQRWGWRRVAVDVDDTTTSESFGLQIIDWIAGCGLVYGTLFGIGKIVLGSMLEGMGYLVFACICAAIIIPHLLAQTSPEPISSPSSNS
jgi:Na+/proline symporter